jgi:hypothetical protein
MNGSWACLGALNTEDSLASAQNEKDISLWFKRATFYLGSVVTKNIIQLHLLLWVFTVLALVLDTWNLLPVPWPNGLGPRPLACWDCGFKFHRGIYVCCECFVLSDRSLRRSNHSSIGVLPTVVRRCVWSRNLVNKEVLAHWGLLRQKLRNPEIYNLY